MSKAQHLLPSHVLREIRRMLEVEIVSQPATGTIEIARSGIVLAFAALADVASEVEVLEEGRDAADRLTRELKIAHAEIERLQLQIIARDLVGRGMPARDRDFALKVGIDAGRRRSAEIVDLTPILAREHRDVGRPIGPDGGAA